MKEVYIKANEFNTSELEKINKYAYMDFTKQDIISVEDLVVIIEELTGKCEELEDKLDQEKNYEENREVFDYSEWKANQE